MGNLNVNRCDVVSGYKCMMDGNDRWRPAGSFGTVTTENPNIIWSGSCSDLIDNDCDGYTDCVDNDCPPCKKNK